MKPHRYVYPPQSSYPTRNAFPDSTPKPNLPYSPNYQNSPVPAYHQEQGHFLNHQGQQLYAESTVSNSQELNVNTNENTKPHLASTNQESPYLNNTINDVHSHYPPVDPQSSFTSASYNNKASINRSLYDNSPKNELIQNVYNSSFQQQPKSNYYSFNTVSSPPNKTPYIQSHSLPQLPDGQAQAAYHNLQAYNAQNTTQNQQVLQSTKQISNYAHPYSYGTNSERDQQLASNLAGMSIHGSFSKLWGNENVNLLQDRNILPPQEDAPITDDHSCDPSIFCCTLNKIPETQSILQKCRLPLGILIHPFKDVDNLPVIHCGTIVRCRACRAYINPFITFIDQKRWKCNLCFRINDVPEDFLYDPSSKTYGDPSRRTELRHGTVEFIAPSEYMLRPPQPAIYLFLLDVSMGAIQTGYLQIFCDHLRQNLENLPGDSRTQIGFITFNGTLQFYDLGEEHAQPHMIVVSDIDDIFLPCPENLLVNLHESKSLVLQLLELLPKSFANCIDSQSCLGTALQAAYKLMSPSGGRVTVIQTCLPNHGPGALKSREDPNLRASKDVPSALLGPSIDFYKKLSLDCIGEQIALDLFLIGSQYADLATLSCIPKYSAGSLYYFPGFVNNIVQRERFGLELNRYLTRKIGFEAVMRVRCTRGLTLHTFHGNCFVRSSDLLSLANVSPDLGYAMQLSIDENLTDIKNVCFQAALLYTTSSGERRIRVHTISHPVTGLLVDIFGAANHQAIIGLISKMAVDRTISSSLSDARAALINACVDLIGAYHMTLPASQVAGSLMIPFSSRLIPLYVNALLKHPAFRVSISTKLDERVFAMEMMKILPITKLMAYIYPPLYAAHIPNYPRFQLTCEKLDRSGIYILATHHTTYVYLGIHDSPPENIHTILELKGVSKDVPLVLVKEQSPDRQLIIQHMVDDRSESQFSYYEFLQHIKLQIEK